MSFLITKWFISTQPQLNILTTACWGEYSREPPHHHSAAHPTGNRQSSIVKKKLPTMIAFAGILDFSENKKVKTSSVYPNVSWKICTKMQNNCTLINHEYIYAYNVVTEHAIISVKLVSSIQIVFATKVTRNGTPNCIWCM